jgi:O-antigen ligase
VTFLDFVPFLVAFFILSRRPFLEAEMRRIHWAILATVPVHFLIGSLQWFYGDTGRWAWMVGGVPAIQLDLERHSTGRISAGFDNPNGLGFFTVLCLIAGFSLLVWYWRAGPRTAVDRRKNLAVIALLVILIGQSLTMLLWSESRNALAATMVSLFALSLLIEIRKLYVGALFALMMSLVLLAGVGLGGLSSAARTFVPSTAMTRLRESSVGVEERRDVFQCAVDLVRARPWTGHGLDTTGRECERRVGRTLNHAHNVFLQIASELGLPFTIVQTLFFGYVFLAVANGLAGTSSSQGGILRSGLLVMAGAVVLMSQVALVIVHSDKFNILFWVALAAPYSVAVGADGSSRRAAGSDVFHPYNPPQ